MSGSFWLDTSDDSIFFAPSSNIPSRSSADSLDINDLPLDNYPSLLLPSRSLNALPLCDYEPVKPPPCPSTSPRRNRRRTQYTFLSLVASLALPKGIRSRRKYANVLVSSPTPGRLRNVPQLKPVLKTWISAVPSSSPPNMAPWSPPHENSHYVWVPEGSCFPPSYLKRYLRERHGPPDTGPPSATFDASRLLSVPRHSENSQSPSRSLSLRRRSSNSAHFTRTPDITPPDTTAATAPSVHIRTKLRRWSISVPPSYLNTEILKHQPEFRRLDATIGTYFAHSETWNEAPLPSIKVSTSTATIAVSIPGSPETPTPIPEPEPLAIRRGKKMLSPLTLRSPKHTDEDYPGIPTAFLGTPSAYSPHFQFPSLNARSETESIAVGDMINTLRSQVADLRPSFPAEAGDSLLDKPPPSNNSLSAESSDIVQNTSEDEWAFAHELMSRYSGHPQSKIPSKERRSRLAATTRKSLTPETGLPAVTQSNRARRASVPLAVSTPKNRPKSSSAPRTDLIKPGNNSTTTKQGKASRLTTPIAGNRRQFTRPVSSPGLSFCVGSSTSDSLDTSPSSAKSEYPPKRPLGILKHVKSVRFADMPTKGDAGDNTPIVGQPQAGTTKGNGTPSSLQPSPLRANFVPGESDTPTPLKQSQATLVSEEPTRHITANRRSSVQKTSVQPTTSRMPVFNTPTFSGVPVASEKANKLSINSQLAARTFSLLAKEHDKDRENIPLALRTRRRMRRYTQVDENAARRASSGEVGSRKHRLSSPLKSFLERLRA